MLAFVAHDTALDRPSDDGTTLRATHEERARRGIAGAEDALESPRFPETLGYLYRWFRELGAAREVSLSGPGRITYQGIDAWARLTDQRPEPHEVSAILQLDATYRHALLSDTTTTDEPAAVESTRAWPTKREAAS